MKFNQLSRMRAHFFPGPYSDVDPFGQYDSSPIEVMRDLFAHAGLHDARELVEMFDIARCTELIELRRASIYSGPFFGNVWE